MKSFKTDTGIIIRAKTETLIAERLGVSRKAIWRYRKFGGGYREKEGKKIERNAIKYKSKLIMKRKKGKKEYSAWGYASKKIDITSNYETFSENEKIGYMYEKTEPIALKKIQTKNKSISELVKFIKESKFSDIEGKSGEIIIKQKKSKIFFKISISDGNWGDITQHKEKKRYKYKPRGAKK